MNAKLISDREDGKKWRFTGNNFHPESGLETNDMSIFKKDPMGSLARESCQNSIDAKREGEKCVKITFQSFKISRDSIPGIDRVEEEINSCYNYQTLKANKEALQRMLDKIKKPEIECLRISDDNTTGLKKVNSLDGSFYLLTKGNGITNKEGVTGGSKGVGKFASFVVSDFNTVFYSTKNEDGEEGYLGISKLCSTIYDEETGERTDGIGYYSKDYRGFPINEQLKIEPGYTRTNPGTDIYILGFNYTTSWKSEIVMKVLDSFMVAIVKGELEVEIDDINLNKETVGIIIEDSNLVTAKNYSKIKSQYILLNDESVSKTTIDMGRYGTAELRLKSYMKDEAHLASYECVMVRYPYMKITCLKNITQVPFSAMCIIDNNDLNFLLRKVENPQHTDWELARLNDDPEMKKEVSRIKREFTDKIYDYIQKTLSVSSNERSDIEGAGDLLPSSDDDIGLDSKNEIVVAEEAQIIPPVKNKVKESSITMKNTDAIGEIPDLVNIDEYGEDTFSVPTGQNSGTGGPIHGGEETKNGGSDGENEGMRNASLSGIKYNVMMPNKSNGEIIIVFNSTQNANNCELDFKYLDDSNNRYSAEITNCEINGQTAVVKDGKVVNFDLIANEKYKIKIKTNLTDYYTSEVSINYESR